MEVTGFQLLDPACLPTSFIVDGKEDEKDEDETEGEDNCVMIMLIRIIHVQMKRKLWMKRLD